MTSNRDIVSNFYVPPKEYIASMTITIEGKGKPPELLQELLNSICFETDDYEFLGKPPISNTNYLTRTVYVKKKNT